MEIFSCQPLLPVLILVPVAQYDVTFLDRNIQGNAVSPCGGFGDMLLGSISSFASIARTLT